MPKNKAFTQGQTLPTHLVGFQLPQHLDILLEDLALSLDRSKGSLLREAVRRIIEAYAEQMGVALAVVEPEPEN